MTTVLSRLARRWQWLALLIVLATPALATHDCLNYSEYFHQLSVMEAGSIRQLAYATPLLFVGSHRIDDWALQLLIFNL
ncbi:hypothetical protein FJ251_12980, partial [bacterium]|nr:hypothetical protein [bacterium]